MANKTFNTRICLKNDTYANWSANDPTPLKGEVCVVVIPADTGAVQGEPVTLFKVGDGTKKFSQLDFVGAKAADVYSWAKAATKPTYQASEITGLSDYISGEIQDTDTQYKLEADAGDGHKFYLYSKPLNGSWGTTPVSTITIPETVYTLVEGTANGTVKFNGTDVKVHGLGSAAYTDSSAYDASGSADAALASAKKYADDKIGTMGSFATVAAMVADAKKAGTDAGDAAAAAQATADSKTTMAAVEAKKYATQTEAKGYADAKDTAIAAAQSAADEAQSGVDGLATRVSAIEDDYLKAADKTELASSIKDVKDDVDAFFKAADVGDTAIDTLKELQDYITTHGEAAATLTTKVGTLETTVGNASAGLVKSVVDNAAAISAEQSRAEGAESGLDTRVKKLEAIDHSLYALKTDVSSDTESLESALNSHIDDAVVHITAAERTAWNGKTTMSAVEAKGYQTAAQVKAIKVDAATAADKLAAPVAINLTGDATGSADFDGSGEISIAVTVTDDSHNHIIGNVDGLQDVLDAKATPADITSAINKLDVTDAAVDGQVVSAVSEADGKISVTRRQVKIDELGQDTYIIFDCGSASTVI